MQKLTAEGAVYQAMVRKNESWRAKAILELPGLREMASWPHTLRQPFQTGTRGK